MDDKKVRWILGFVLQVVGVICGLGVVSHAWVPTLAVDLQALFWLGSLSTIVGVWFVVNNAEVGDREAANSPRCHVGPLLIAAVGGLSLLCFALGLAKHEGHDTLGMMGVLCAAPVVSRLLCRIHDWNW